jgi:transcriptional regulator with XRE-family HTH domain
MDSIIEQLKAARQQLGIKQSELGSKLGLPQSHISKIEQVANDPRLSTLADMARILDLELMLIPRQLLPAVRALLKGEAPPTRRFQPDEPDENNNV